MVKLLGKFNLFVYFKRFCLQQSHCCGVDDDGAGVCHISEQMQSACISSPRFPARRPRHGWLSSSVSSTGKAADACP